MVASYSPNRLTKQGTNDNPNTWGTVLNTQVIALVDEFVAGVVQVSITGSSNVALTTNNGSTDEARHATLELTGTLGANIELHVPALEKQYFIRGLWSGAYTVTVKISGASTSVVMESGDKKIVYVNGTDIYDMTEERGISVSSDDTTPGSLEDKLVTNGALELTTLDPGANETRQVSVNTNFQLSALGLQSGQSFKVGADENTDITIMQGGYASLNGVFMEVTSDITKGIDATWTAGTGNGGLDTGTVQSSQVYYIHIIHNLTSGVVDGLFSLSRTAPTMPSGYAERRCIGFVRTNTSSEISEWNIIWTSFGPFSAPLLYLVVSTDDSNVVQNCYLVFNTNPADLGERVIFTNLGGVFADDDVGAFTT